MELEHGSRDSRLGTETLKHLCLIRHTKNFHVIFYCAVLSEKNWHVPRLLIDL